MTTRPRLAVISGPPGVGKTTLAHALAEALGWPVVCRDEIKERMVAGARVGSGAGAAIGLAAGAGGGSDRGNGVGVGELVGPAEYGEPAGPSAGPAESAELAGLAWPGLPAMLPKIGFRPQCPTLALLDLQSPLDLLVMSALVAV